MRALEHAGMFDPVLGPFGRLQWGALTAVWLIGPVTITIGG
ncbi:MAG: hypothetical protein ABIO86_09565 [Sphingomonas sp.]